MAFAGNLRCIRAAWNRRASQSSSDPALTPHVHGDAVINAVIERGYEIIEPELCIHVEYVVL